MAMCSMMGENGVQLTMTPEEANALWSCLNGLELNSEPYLEAVESVLNRGVHYSNEKDQRQEITTTKPDSNVVPTGD